MEPTKEYIVENANEYLDIQYHEIEVFAEGDSRGMSPENYELCKKVLPCIPEFDKQARNYLPTFFKLPKDMFEPWTAQSCWGLESITFGQVLLLSIEAKVRGFIMRYCYEPPNSTSVYDCFYIDVKFQEQLNTSMIKAG